MEITKKAKQQLTASPAIIDLQGIVKRFYIGKPNELEILHGIDFQVQEGQFVSIVGESGSGKSTLMNIIGALDQPTGGQYPVSYTHLIFLPYFHSKYGSRRR